MWNQMITVVIIRKRVIGISKNMRIRIIIVVVKNNLAINST